MRDVLSPISDEMKMAENGKRKLKGEGREKGGIRIHFHVNNINELLLLMMNG